MTDTDAEGYNSKSFRYKIKAVYPFGIVVSLFTNKIIAIAVYLLMFSFYQYIGLKSHLRLHISFNG